MRVASTLASGSSYKRSTIMLKGGFGKATRAMGEARGPLHLSARLSFPKSVVPPIKAPHFHNAFILRHRMVARQSTISPLREFAFRGNLYSSVASFLSDLRPKHGHVAYLLTGLNRIPSRCCCLRWQETDYRDFRINFIQFMRSPPPVVDTPEMASVDIVAESSQGPPATEEKRQESERVEDGDSQPVMIDAVMYDDAQTCDPHSTESVRAWVVSPDEGRNGQSGDASNRHVAGPSRDDVGNATDEACIEGESAASLSAAAATAAVAAAATTPNEASTEITPASATENPSACVTDGGEDTATSSPGDSSKSRSAEAASLPPCDLSDHPSDDAAVKVTMGNVSGTPAAADGMGGTWEEQESNRRVAPSLSWDSSSSTGDEDDVEEGDGDDNCIRVRRSFSNLETARRRGAGLDSEIVSEASDSSEDDGSGGGHIGSRPRALSLDGWFVCGLENGVTAPSYDTHDHAERLRELVKLVRRFSQYFLNMRLFFIIQGSSHAS